MEDDEVDVEIIQEEYEEDSIGGEESPNTIIDLGEISK
jgi:hypothetical protein